MKARAVIVDLKVVFLGGGDEGQDIKHLVEIARHHIENFAMTAQTEVTIKDVRVVTPTKLEVIKP